jgi:hypothetical protein
MTSASALQLSSVWRVMNRLEELTERKSRHILALKEFIANQDQEIEWLRSLLQRDEIKEQELEIEWLRSLNNLTIKKLEDRTLTCKQLEDIVSKQNAEIKELQNREARYEATIRWKNRQLEDEKRVRVETVKSQKEKMEQMQEQIEQLQERLYSYFWFAGQPARS